MSQKNSQSVSEMVPLSGAPTGVSPIGNQYINAKLAEIFNQDGKSDKEKRDMVRAHESVVVEDQRIHYTDAKTRHPEKEAARKSAYRQNINALIPEVAFILYSILGASMAFFYTRAAFEDRMLPQDNPAYNSDPNIDPINAYKNAHPTYTWIAYAGSIIFSLLDYVNNLAIVDPKGQANESSGYYTPQSYYDALTRQKGLEVGGCKIDEKRIAELTTDIDAELSKFNLTTQQVEGYSLLGENKKEVGTGVYYWLTRFLCADASFAVGALGDLIPFVILDPTLPQFLQKLTFPADKSVGEYVGLSALTAYFLVSGYTYYRMYAMGGVMKTAKLLLNGPLVDRNNKSGTFNAYWETFVAATIRAAGMGFILENIFNSPNSFYPVGFGTAFYWFAFGTGFFNTASRSLSGILEKNIGAEAEQGIPGRNLPNSTDLTYSDLAKIQIEEMSFVDRHRDYALGAVTFSLGLSGLITLELLEHTDTAQGQIVAGVAGVAAFIALLVFKSKMGMNTKLSQMARAEFYKDKYNALLNKRAEVNSDVRKAVLADAKQQPSIEVVVDSNAEDTKTNGDKSAVQKLAGKYEDLVTQSEDALDKIAHLGGGFTARVRGEESARGWGYAINGGAQVARYMLNVAFSMLLLHKYLHLSARASTFAVMVIAFESSMNNFNFNAAKTQKGISNLAGSLSSCFGSRQPTNEDQERLLADDNDGVVAGSSIN